MGSLKDDNHKLGCSIGHCLEVFLFSNGQRDSPPRKYNVRVDDQCDTTLSFLARSQNGSDHNIELYTTDGKKIRRAQDLSNGAAYVAVEPPQAFIPSGYNDYLMKASRSREKRQEKLPEKGSIKPDKTNSKHETEEQMKDGTNIKIIQDITIRPTSKTAVKEEDGTAERNKSESAKIAKPIGRINNKQAQKKSSSLPQPNTNILRKNTNNVTTPIKRKINTSKIDAMNKKVESSSLQSTKTNPITKIIESKSKEDIAGVIAIIKNNRENTDSAEAYDLLKNIDTTGGPYNMSTDYKTTQLLTVDSMLIEKNSMLKSEYTMPVKIHSKVNLLSNSVPDQNVKLVPQLLSDPPLRESPLTDYSKETDRTQIKTAELTEVPKGSQKNTLIFGSQTGDNNFTIYVKQSDVTNLKLNIELKNVSSSMLEEKHYYVKSTTSVVNTPESDFQESSKTRTEAKSYREAPTLTEPWHPQLSYEQLQLKANDQEGDCRCNCCSCSRTEGAAPIYVDNNNYFILLPPEDINKPLLSCACNVETNQDPKREMPDYHELPRMKNHIIGKLVRHNSSPTDASNLNKRLDTSKSVVMGDHTDQCQCCDCDQSLDLEFPVYDQERVTCGGCVTREHALVNKSTTQLKEAFTQTDWSGIVLEVRPRENGSYEFHIPSLKVLKMADSLYL
ncbi:uncharacterized protein LOC133519530 [Cydia pomonella]|uniref:uncharacterized protein LOC133519530 n=1 Tax=Cydia pomonella TaxID=82600 RepID=UPI002ADD9350|nr:uncharacterized protein LOC133519530 [Cydia pomonella]